MEVTCAFREPDADRHYLPADLAAALRARRKARGLSQRRAAAAAGISHGYLWLLEEGHRCPSIAVAEGLIAGLELSPDLAGWLRNEARPDAGRSSTAAAVEERVRLRRERRSTNPG